MRKTLILVLAVATFSCSLLAGCGNTAVTANNKATTTETNESAESKTTENKTLGKDTDNKGTSDEKSQYIDEMKKYLESKYNKQFYFNNDSFKYDYVQNTDTKSYVSIMFSDTSGGDNIYIVEKYLVYNEISDNYWIKIADKTLFENYLKNLLVNESIECSVKIEFEDYIGARNYTSLEINSNSSEEEWLEIEKTADKRIEIHVSNYNEVTNDLKNHIRRICENYNLHGTYFIFDSTEADKSIFTGDTASAFDV